MKKAANFIRPNYLVFPEPFGRTMQFKHKGPSDCDTNFQSWIPTGHTHHQQDYCQQVTSYGHQRNTYYTWLTGLLPTGDITWTPTGHTQHVTNRITADSWHHTDTNQTHTPRHWQDYCWQVTSHRHQQDTHTTHHWQDYCQQVTSHTLHIVDRITANRWHHSSMRQHQERAKHLDFLFLSYLVNKC